MIRIQVLFTQTSKKKSNIYNFKCVYLKIQAPTWLSIEASITFINLFLSYYLHNYWLYTHTHTTRIYANNMVHTSNMHAYDHHCLLYSMLAHNNEKARLNIVVNINLHFCLAILIGIWLPALFYLKKSIHLLFQTKQK